MPLFVEELTKSVLESGLLREEADHFVLDHALPPFAIPTSLHDSLMARLDRLASVRHVAQIGAAIGREFPYALVHTVSHLSHDELQAALARLVASELVFQRGSPPAAVLASNTHWCRMRLMAAYCAAPGSNRTRRLPTRLKPNLPS